jgi:hypothetical protein
MTLDADDIESIATRVAELLRDEVPPSPARLADAAEVARELGVDRDWVYAHARELGGVRLGGERGRLRFDLAKVRRQLACPREPKLVERPRSRPRRHSRRPCGNVDLLPYTEVRSTPAKQVAGRRGNAPGPTTGDAPMYPYRRTSSRERA